MMITKIDHIEFGKRLGVSRRLRGVTQGEASRRLDLHYNAFQRYEKGKPMSLDTFYSYVMTFDVSADYLLGGIEIIQRCTDKNVVSMPRMHELHPEDVELVSNIIDILIERRKSATP